MAKSSTGIVLTPHPYEPERSHQTRQRIIDAAFKLVAKRGAHALSLSELARQSRLSKPRIAYHYDDMEQVLAELYEAFIAKGRAETEKRVAAAKTPVEKIEAIVLAFFAWMSDNPELGRFELAMFAYASVSEKVGALHRQFLSGGVKRIEAILADSGVAEPQRATLALASHNQIVGSILRSLSSGDTGQPEKQAKEVHVAVTRLLGFEVP